ncbi:MAG: ADP-ribosylglycohydrolase family protein [Clostridia bacterium]|nr:ADP-ribosylglycohydrolase family protein [Clostridia bacterium]
MKVKLNKKEFTDRLLGCWIGKNIGGTMGDPFEGKREMLSITGFTTQKGEPAPNDDLDLQLVWLKALGQYGPKGLGANELANFWVTHITPNWNEYGISKRNLEMGLLPPLSGEFQNGGWKNSNGAWIRSEIWACLAPGVPNIAIKYAIMDASVDHGQGEGTYAEIFTASLESMAFFETDIRKVVEKGLEFIPQDCRVAKSVRIVLDGYDNNVPWQEVRQQIVKDSEDLGWFQAPANVAFTVLGLIYGEGDFKKSMLYTINCGDDTDCTGATCGAIMGIVMGAEKIPADWKEYIGDRILTKCINGEYVRPIPKTCTELVNIIMDMVPEVMKAHGVEYELTDGENEICGNPDDVLKGNKESFFAKSPYSFEIPSHFDTDAIVEYETEPVVKPGCDFEVKITLKNKEGFTYYDAFVGLPDGWTADYERSSYSHIKLDDHYGNVCWKMTIHVGEKVDGINRVPVVFTPKYGVMPITVPIVLIG